MRRIKIKVTPRARKNIVIEQEGKLKVYVTAPPVDGKANKVLIETLAEYFKVKKSNIRIIKGEKTKEKIIEINE